MENTVVATRFEFDEAKIEYIQKAFTNRFKFRLLLFRILPMGYLTGMKVDVLDRERCEVTVKYKWLNKNPFRSTFWAVLGMAAEMASGALLTMYTYKQKPSVATLVIGQDAKFHKKAVGTTRFICENGLEIAEAVRETCSTGEPVQVVCPIKGYDEAGELTSEFTFTWSFKARTKKS